MSRSRRLAEDHKFSHPFQASRKGAPCRLSFSDSRQLEKVDKNTRRTARLTDQLNTCEWREDPISDLFYELDCVQEQIITIISKKLAVYPNTLNSLMLPYLRVKQSKLLNCLERMC